MKEVIEKEAVVEEQPKKWQFRELKGKDIFLMLPVLKRIGINNLKKCISGDLIKGINAEHEGEAREKQIEAATYGAMLEFGQVLIEGLAVEGCDDAIYKLLSGVSNLTYEEVKEDLGLLELPEMIMDFVKKDEFKGFLKVAQQYIK